MRSLPRWESMTDSGSPNRAILATEVGLDRLHHRDGPECARPRPQQPPDGRARPFVARDLTSRDAAPEDGRTPSGSQRLILLTAWWALPPAMAGCHQKAGFQ